MTERRRTETPQTRTFMLQPRPTTMESDQMEFNKRPRPMVQKQISPNIRPGSFVPTKPVRSENYLPPEFLNQHVARVSQQYSRKPPKGYSYLPGEEAHSEEPYGQFVDPFHGGKSRRNRKRKTRKTRKIRKMKRRRPKVRGR